MAETTKYKITDKINHELGWDWDKHVSQSYLDNGTKKIGNSTSVSDIVEAGSTLVLAGPASLSNTALTTETDAASAGNDGVRLVPIGLVENAAINMSKPVNRIFEIGSKISYLIPGRTVGGINLSRVFFDGASLLKILYAGEVLDERSDLASKYATFSSDPTAANKDITTGNGATFENISSGNVGMNLASSFFDHPFGLGFVFKDQDAEDVGFIYFEGCHVTSYGMSINAGANVLIEGVNMEFTKIVPVVSAVSGGETTNPVSLSDRNIVQ